MISFKDYDESPLMKKIAFKVNEKLVIKCANIKEHPIHIHDSAEIIYVLCGSVSVKVSNQLFVLEKGDFLIVNSYDVHAISDNTESQEDNIIGIIHFSEKVLDPSHGIFIWDLELLKQNEDLYSEIRSRIEEIIQLYIIESENAEIVDRIPESTSALLTLVKANYMVESYNIAAKGKNRFVNNDTTTSRLGSLVWHLYSYYDEKLSLDTVANYCFVSKYYLSHFIKQAFGISFQELINTIRVERAEIKLLGTDLTISQISLEVGFSSYRYFSQHFKSFYNMRPQEYRNACRKETVRYKPFRETEILLSPQGFKELLVDNTSCGTSRQITVNLHDNNYIVKELTEHCGDVKANIHTSFSNITLNMDEKADELIIIIKKQERDS